MARALREWTLYSMVYIVGGVVVMYVLAGFRWSLISRGIEDLFWGWGLCSLCYWVYSARRLWQEAGRPPSSKIQRKLFK